MSTRDLRDLFESFSPTPEQEAAMLDRLLRGERTKRTVKFEKLWKRGLAAAACAAALLLACAFTMASGLDEKLMALFGAGTEDARQIAGGVVQADQVHTYENGWTAELKQVLVDRYTLAALVELTAPEGTSLSEENCTLFAVGDVEPGGSGEGIGGYVNGAFVLPDGDPMDNHITFLYHRSPTSYLGGAVDPFLGSELTFTLRELNDKWGEDCIADFTEEPYSFTVTLPDRDSGRQYRLEQSTRIGDEEVVLADLYLSPISVAFTLQVQPNDPRLWGMTEFSDVMDTTVLTLADGGTVRAENAYGQSYDPTTGEARFVFRLGQITDPEQVASLSFLDQTFSLEGLEPEGE